MLTYRFAQADDVKLYYDWANDAAVRENSFNSDPIKYADHEAWFYKNIKSTNIAMLLFFLGTVPVGQARIQIENGEGTINFSVSKEFRGEGIGALILTEVKKYFFSKSKEHKLLKGFVKFSNMGSEKAFIKAGFEKITQKDALLFLVRHE